MGRGVFRNLSFVTQSQAQPQRERTEPRLLPANAPLPFRRPAEPEPAILSAARDHAATITPLLSAADRRPIATATPESSSLRYIALAGCAVFVLAGIASAGFLMLTAPRPEPVATTAPAPAPSGPAVAPSPQPDADRAPAPLKPVTARPTATAMIPVPVAPPHSGAETTAMKPNTLPRLSPASATIKPASAPVAVAAKPEHPSSHPVVEPSGLIDHPAAAARPAVTQDRRTAAAPAKAAHDRIPLRQPTEASHGRSTIRLPTAAAADRAAPKASAEAADVRSVAGPPAVTHRLARAHFAERRTHLHPEGQTRLMQPAAGPAHAAHATIAPSEQPARFGGPAAAKPADQNAAFDQLMAHLTGSAKPAEPVVHSSANSFSRQPSNSFPSQPLTPPAAGAPDPFAPRPGDGSPNQ